MKQPFLSVVIPAYNEEKRIGLTLSKVMGYAEAKGLSCEIVVADDGCRDNTEKVVRETVGTRMALQYLPGGVNRGKGHAVKRGMLAAIGDYALLTDADLSTPITELDKFLPLMNSVAAVLVGNRKTLGSSVVKHQPWLRENMGKVFTLLTNLMLGMRQSDFTCGFKVFGRVSRAEVFRRSRIERWGYDSEILFLAKRLGYNITDVPVIWENSEATKVNLVKDTLRSLKELVQIRWNGVGE
ncbi:MAG: dolichyl-phosphate beta-glucosyltransferase [Fibrobacterota bacterium]